MSIKNEMFSAVHLLSSAFNEETGGERGDVSRMPLRFEGSSYPPSYEQPTL